MIDTDGKFYLGRINDPATGETGDEMLLYDPDDPDDRVVRYTRAILRARLDARMAVPLFDDQRPMPVYLAGTLLAHYVSEYERFRVARGRSHAGVDRP